VSTAEVMKRSDTLGERARKCPHTRNTRENCYSSKIHLGTLGHIIEYCHNNYEACVTYKMLSR
jgi:hypothetical protein